MKEFGQELAKQAFPKKPRVKKERPKPVISRSQAKLHRRWLKQNRGVNLNPEPKPVKPHLGIGTVEPLPEALGWSRFKYDHEGYVAEEVVILIRPAPDTPTHVFMAMHHVRGYIDINGSVMLRPTTAPELASGILALPAPTEAVKGALKPPGVVRTAVPVVLGGTHGLNPAKEGTKRFFLVESLIRGGTAVEIVKQADKMARKGGYKKGQVEKIITPTMKKVTEFAEKMAARVGRAGKRVTVQVKGKMIQIVADEGESSAGPTE